MLKSVGTATRPQILLLLALIALLLANAILFVLAGEVILPKFITVRSGGFSFPAMEDSNQLIRNMLLTGLLSAAVLMGMLYPHPEFRGIARRAVIRPLALSPKDTVLLFSVLAFFWGMYAAYPPQISATNFRIIWVDWASSDLKIRYLGQMARDFFYEYPQALQATAALASFLSLQGIGRRVGLPVFAACAFSMAACASAIFLQFAGVGEDWAIVTAASLMTLWAYAVGRWAWVVLALVLLGGLRLPTALLVLISIATVEMGRAISLVYRRPDKFRWVVPWTAARLAIVSVLTCVAAYLAYLHFSGIGDDIASGAGANLEQMEIDGFRLTRFSGAYVAHALWGIPAIVLASCVTVLFFAGRYLSSSAGRIALVSALAMGGNVLMYEASVDHQFYYNYRYLAMAYPLGLPALMYVLAKFRLGPIFAVMAVLSMLISLPTDHAWRAPTEKLTERQQIDHELYSCRRVFSPWLGQKSVYVTTKGKALANAVRYVKMLDGADTEERGVVYLNTKKTKFNKNEVVLLKKRPRDDRWIELAKLRQVASCRGWSVLSSG